MMKFCTECGRKLEKDFNYCPGCGMKLPDGWAKEQEAESPASVPPEIIEEQAVYPRRKDVRRPFVCVYAGPDYFAARAGKTKPQDQQEKGGIAPKDGDAPDTEDKRL